MPQRLPGCIICRQNDPTDTCYPVDIIAQNRLWLVHHCHAGPPPGVSKPWGQPHAETGGPVDLPGHLLFHAQRHVHGPADFDAEETANYTYAIQHVSRLLLEVTKAERIYVAMIGETGPHLHAHLIPRYSDSQLEDMGIDVGLGSAMGVFDLYRKVAAGTHPPADPVVVASMVSAMKAKLATSPLPLEPGHASAGLSRSHASL